MHAYCEMSDMGQNQHSCWHSRGIAPVIALTFFVFILRPESEQPPVVRLTYISCISWIRLLVLECIAVVD